MSRNLTNENINGLIALNKKCIKEMLCNMRGMARWNTPSLVRHTENTLDNTGGGLYRAAGHPHSLPQELQAIEWELSQIVKEAGELLREAGQAIEHCHAIRAGNETTTRLLDERERLRDQAVTEYEKGEQKIDFNFFFDQWLENQKEP